VIIIGNMIAGIPPALLYIGPSAILGYPLIPEWLTAACILAAPIAYFIATMQHDLLQIDRILNRSVVYAILSFVIIIFCVTPISIIYLYIGNKPGNIVIITGLLLLAAIVFERTRVAIQRVVDRVFYGGWYDYPGMVEKISDALAYSLEWEQLVDILTRQTPAWMALQGGHLQIQDQSTPMLDRSAQPQLQLPLVFEEKTCGLWTVGPRRDGEDFSSDDLRILHTLAHQAAIAVNVMLMVKQMRAQFEEIRASRELLAQTGRQLLTTREEERARLARDLHDGPVQELIGLNIHLGMLVPVGDTSSVQDMREEVKSLIYDLRAICAELRPPLLDTLGLGAALRALIQDWSKQSGIPVDIELPAASDFLSLPEHVAVNLYRIAQEALSNIEWHSKASRVKLKVVWDLDNSLLTMIIQDDGIGFVYDPSNRSIAVGHLGLINMKERVALIGGELSVDTSPGMGTIIHVMYQLVKQV
jgi:signal transduction histidine kinase